MLKKFFTEQKSYSRLASHTITETTADFLLRSKVDTYYKGEIHKEYGNIPSKMSDRVKGFQDFFSYKFNSPINGTPRTFCVTFRQKPSGRYYVRLSLIEKEEEEDSKKTEKSSSQVTCKHFHESLILDSIGQPEKPPQFSSITSGLGNTRNTRDISIPIDSISIVKEMEELAPDATWKSLPTYIRETTDSIKGNIGHLGQLLVDHCDKNVDTSSPPPSPAPASPTFPPSLLPKETSERVTFENGDTYTGTFLERKQNGKGVYTWKSGDTYDGEWLNGKRHGKGVMTFATTGDTYDGEWLNDEFNGSGVYTWKSGNKYEGNWLDDKRHGSGVYTDTNGNKYEGNWLDDKRHGIGVFTNFKGEKYDGEWVGDKRQGKGVLTFTNGDTYNGEWLNGNKHGKGVYTDAGSGNKTPQNWDDGKMVKEGGATRRHTRLTRRRKSVFKRKGKKSYRKKKYGKTKKSRRFRRSVRSRR
jgi:hypothetical protein